MAKSKHASTKPSEAEKGGGAFGFPPGSVVTIKEASWARWEDAGEKAIVKSRSGDDPALRIVGEIEGGDGEAREVFLSAGKATRGLHPSRDGEFLDIEEGATATAIADGCNADVFLKSISDKKAHKKMAVPEELHDDGISAVLVGLKFVAGGIVIKREGLDNPSRPTLVADEIVELPKAARKGKAKDEDDEDDEKPARRRKAKPAVEDDDEDDEDEKPKRGRKSGGGDAEAKAEKAMAEVLDNPKYKKGLPVEKAWTAVFNLVREDEDKKAILALIEDEDWLTGDRPWQVKGKGEDAVILPV